LVFLLVLSAETLVVVGLIIDIFNLVLWALLALIPIILFVVIGKFYGKFEFWPKSTIFTKLMANAIAPSWWGAFYLLFFVIHIGWLTNGSFDLYKSDNTNIRDIVISLVTGLIGLLVLICFFPDGKVDKKKAKKIVFVSGISKLQTYTSYDFLNLIPLISTLSMAFRKNDDGNVSINYNNISKFLILNSSVFKDDSFSLPKVELDITKHKEYIDKIEKLKEIFKNSIVIETNEKKEPIKIIVTLGIDYDKSSNSVKEKLRYIIKDAAMLEYPEQSELIRNLRIDFTEACDYDSFKQCFETLNDAIKKEDNNEQRLFFNLTPGTGIVGSLMTLFSIDKDRELFFYAQMTSKLLLPVDKSRLPLENLLSQALEKIKEQKN
jgi:hypothetical protein